MSGNQALTRQKTGQAPQEYHRGQAVQGDRTLRAGAPQRGRTPERDGQKRYRKRRRDRAVKRFLLLVSMCVICLGSIALVIRIPDFFSGLPSAPPFQTEKNIRTSRDVKAYFDTMSEEYPEDLIELFEKNEEARDYVLGYPERREYLSRSIDLSEDLTAGEVPLLMQWDRRWGYDDYGSSMIGLAGCGPVCLDMVYLYFTQDTEMTPREMAAFAYDRGYYTEAGTSWSLWTEGAALLGLDGAELSLDENVMKRALDSGGLIVCSMRPGDFTTTGHFILIKGYGADGFYVNDPNRRSNSGKVWDYDTLRGQIKNLWVLRDGIR